jgi:aldose 1-epimerase
MRLLHEVCASLAILGTLPAGGFAVGNYAVTKKTVERHLTYHLIDAQRKMDFGVVPDIGNLGYEFKVDGKDVLLAPDSLEAYRTQRALGRGNPLMAPFANRIDREHYYFQGKKYLLNDALGNFIRAGSSNLPIHGLLAYDPRWEVVKTGASNREGAYITSRIDFYKYPELMAQFPFAHIWEITYRLKDGALECSTTVKNVGQAPMPVHFGYHPYFVPDGPREEWTLHIAAKRHWIVDDRLIPTGELEPTETFLPGSTGVLTLRKTFIDGGFTALDRDTKGQGRFWVAGKTRKVEVVFDRNYETAIVFAPLDTEMVCIEPQTGPTNAFNLQHEGKFRGLIVLDSSKTFRATFWIIPTGF